MWRWSFKNGESSRSETVFSTYVEVILSVLVTTNLTLCILHVCGGDPVCVYCVSKASMYSPRMWRWSLSNGLSFPITISILHVCGGDPTTESWFSIFKKYSPRMWRWSCNSYCQYSKRKVFSTYVEVILIVLFSFLPPVRILHVCGGDP